MSRIDDFCKNGSGSCDPVAFGFVHVRVHRGFNISVDPDEGLFIVTGPSLRRFFACSDLDGAVFMADCICEMGEDATFRVLMKPSKVGFHRGKPSSFH